MKQVVIAGAGIMGASLAQVYSLAGWNTYLYNRSDAGIEKAKKLIGINQQVLVENGIIDQETSDNALASISFSTDMGCFATADLILESIVEDLSAKKSFWQSVSMLAREDALLATNTSGLHISDIALAVKGPHRFAGQHWLNPPHLLPLCEIVVGEETSPETVEKMKGLILGLNKTPVVVRDINGFIINRLQFAVLREALHIVEIGAASLEDVDAVMKGGLGLRYAALGPFGVADMGGLDTFDHISSYLNADLCDSKTVSPILHDIVSRGELGIKTGKGFYRYDGDKAEQAIRERDSLYIALAKTLYFGN